MKIIGTLVCGLALLCAATAQADTTSASQSAAQSGSQSASSSANAQNTNLTFNGPAAPTTTTVRDVPTIFAPGLVAGVGNCLGSAAMGGGGPGWGFTLGGTHEGHECLIQKYAEFAFRIGDNDTGVQILCESKIYRIADAKTKHSCK